MDKEGGDIFHDIDIRIVAVAQLRAQSGNVQLRCNEVASYVLRFRRCHGGIEFDQDVARLHALAVMHVNYANDPGLKRLYQLDAAARDDLPGRECNNIDLPEGRPG